MRDELGVSLASQRVHHRDGCEHGGPWIGMRRMPLEFQMLLTDFDALTFDCYGTLIDWEGGMIAALKGLTDRAQRPLTRDLILQAHARQESSQQRYTPTKRYSDLLAVVYKRLAEEWGVHATHEECAAYGRSIGDWPAFEDSAQALAYLKQHFKLVILSNVDNESFRMSNQKLGVVFDAIYTAEDIGSYKPSAQNFDYMIEKLDACGVKKAKILHTAESMFHDHKPANDHGLKSCWIYRRHEKQGFGATMDPGQKPHVDFTFHSMRAFAQAHQQQLGIS
jgi:2-haloacid dehalogenase